MMKEDGLFNAARRILRDYWDPIGVRDVPSVHEEYDEYAGRVAKMLAAGSSVGELSNYLMEIEIRSMGLRGDSKRARMVAEELLQLRKP